MKINLVLMDQTQSYHSGMYEDAVNMYYDLIKNLGYDIETSINILKPTHLNIILF